MKIALESTQAAIQAFVTQKKRQKVLVAGSLIWDQWKSWRKWNNYMKYVDIMWMVLDCSDRAVDKIFLKKQNKAAVVIQTRWRGYSARQEMFELINKVKKAKQDFLENRANATILRFLKGRMARLKIKKI